MLSFLSSIICILLFILLFAWLYIIIDNYFLTHSEQLNYKKFFDVHSHETIEKTVQENKKTKSVDTVNVNQYNEKNYDLVGKKVLHKDFGLGEIIEKKEKEHGYYITVRFETKTAKFVFPDAWYKHLFPLENKTEIQEKKIPKIPEKADDILKKPAFVEPKKTYHKLVYNRIYGTNSRVIYLNCCKWFQWDENQKNNFGKQGALLYAKNATKEGYSPWFIAHSNFCPGKGGKWKNTIEGDYIFEDWDSPDYEMFNDKTVRVVFVKKGTNYYFYGIYVVDEIQMQDNYKYRKTYKRIKNNYLD